MKILILCDEGNNRSVVLASRLKYCGDGHDILTAGNFSNSSATIIMLGDWAEKIIVVEEAPWVIWIKGWYPDKVELWDIGPDIYPRPHNKELLKIVTKLIKDHPELTKKATDA